MNIYLDFTIAVLINVNVVKILSFLQSLTLMFHAHIGFFDAIFPPLRPQHITIKPQCINLDFEFSIINDESPPEDYHDEV